MDVFSQYFKPVPSNPYYYFYCPLSSKKDVSPQLLPFIQKTQNGDLHKESEMEQELIIYWFLCCQEDSEDGEMSRRPTEESFLEAEPSTEDGEL